VEEDTAVGFGGCGSCGRGCVGDLNPQGTLLSVC
jgi:hypothetical protein